jgi:sugar phosphate isomerase/epimerase
VKIGIQLVDDYYLPYPKMGMRMLADAGFDCAAMDLSPFILPPEPSPSSSETDSALSLDFEELKKRLLPYKREAEKYDLVFSQMNAPSITQLSESGANRELFEKAVSRCIEICGFMGSPYLVVHPFRAGSLNSRTEWEENRDFYISLSSAANKHHVTLCLENEYDDRGGHYVRGACSDPRTAANYVDMLNREAGEELFSLCLNTGNCNFFGQNMYEAAAIMGKRIRAVRIHANTGALNQRAKPNSCTADGTSPSTDWRGLVRGLREAGYDGDLCFISDGSVKSFPCSMRLSVMRLIHETGRFMAGQIEIEKALALRGQIVLFGAGRMFENYMSCYGKKYPPAFAVDNNAALWGNTVMGVPVKAPEAIREVCGDYGVFICSQFYYNIERQLSDMGVTNIYHFHDEYMPLGQSMEEK